MKLQSLFFLSFLLMISSNNFSQINDEELGKAFTPTTGLYDFSDRGAVNIKVSVWGYVARPGKYIVPDYTTVSDLLSFAGGPNQNAEMDDLRIFRTLENGKEELVKFTYDDVLWGYGIEEKNRFVPKLEPSDILVVPGSPRLFFRDYLSIGLQIMGIIFSVLNIIILMNVYR